VVVANVPYVPTAAVALMPPEAREHENRIALDGGTDGLDVLRRVLAQVATWLAPDGYLLVECSEEQSADALAEFTAAALTARIVTDDELAATVVVGRQVIGRV
jgi:release factor glutamine methyltransferase